MSDYLKTLYPHPPEAINLTEVEKQRVVKEERTMEKMKVGFKSCQYALMAIGLFQVGMSSWAFIAPDATIYKNLKGLPATERAYYKQWMTNCVSVNYFADNSDNCNVAGSALATLFKGEAVIAHFDLDPVKGSTQKHSQWEQEAAAAETSQGNVQSPAN